MPTSKGNFRFICYSLGDLPACVLSISSPISATSEWNLPFQCCLMTHYVFVCVCPRPQTGDHLTEILIWCSNTSTQIGPVLRALPSERVNISSQVNKVSVCPQREPFNDRPSPSARWQPFAHNNEPWRALQIELLFFSTDNRRWIGLAIKKSRQRQDSPNEPITGYRLDHCPVLLMACIFCNRKFQ